jgi:hypothetical protein
VIGLLGFGPPNPGARCGRVSSRIAELGYIERALSF